MQGWGAQECGRKRELALREAARLFEQCKDFAFNPLKSATMAATTNGLVAAAVNAVYPEALDPW